MQSSKMKVYIMRRYDKLYHKGLIGEVLGYFYNVLSARTLVSLYYMLHAYRVALKPRLQMLHELVPRHTTTKALHLFG